MIAFNNDRWSSKLILAVQHNRDGAVVNNTDQHMRPEYAGLHFQARLRDALYEIIIQFFRHLRWRSPDEAGAPPVAGVGQQCKLADHQQLRFYVQSGEVKFTIVIAEYPEIDYFVRQIIGVLLTVITAYAEQYEKALTYAAGHPAVYRNL